MATIKQRLLRKVSETGEEAVYDTIHLESSSDLILRDDGSSIEDSLESVETEASESAAGLMSAADKTKLNGIANNANNYTHPSSAAGALTSGLYKVTTDGSGHVVAGTAVTKTDITNLGIPAQDTVYTHPTGSGNNHIPAGGSAGQILQWSSDGTAVWANNTGGSTLQLDSIYIDTAPTKVAYKAGEVFDPTGMVIKANYALDGAILVRDQVVTGYTYTWLLELPVSLLRSPVAVLPRLQRRLLL